MAIPHRDDVTMLLRRMAGGDLEARDRLLGILHDYLYRRACLNIMAAPACSLGPTALVDEAYMRLARPNENGWENREQFLEAAAKTMKRILLDHVRSSRRMKRAGDRRRVPLDDLAEQFERRNGCDVVAFSELLETMEQFDPELARAALLRAFGGWTMQEIAKELDLPQRTLERLWHELRTEIERRLR